LRFAGLPFSVLEVMLIAFIIVAAAVNGAIYGGVLTTTAHTPQAVLSPSQRAELDDSRDLPGRFVPSQGRQHTAGAYPEYARIGFCDDARATTPCYASNPPTSGTHLPVQRIRLSDGRLLNLPPDPGIYNFVIPREAIPHIEEHAGVYAGYSCSSSRCNAAVERLIALAKAQISNGARVIVSPDTDLADNTIALVAWTRIDSFSAADYSDDRALAFIKAHSCRFDPEGKCATGARSASIQWSPNAPAD